MRYVCTDCGSVFYEPKEKEMYGELHDCCPMCASVNVSKDKSFNELEKSLIEANNDLDEVIEKCIDAKCTINRKLKELDDNTNIADVFASLEKIQNNVGYIRKNFEAL